MTLIELGIVMGIVSVLIALVLGLGRHVDAAVKIRRAQADLGEWHETMNRWYLQFGEYPFMQINSGGKPELINPLNAPKATINYIEYTDVRANLTILTNENSGCFVRYESLNTNVTFRSFMTTSIKTIDPWDMPYIYIPSDNSKAYTLFSCGADSKTILSDGTGIPTGTPSTPDPTLDDIYFER